MTDRPWLRFYGDVPRTIAYPEVTLYEALRATAERFGDAPAWEYFGKTQSYRAFLDEIDRFAAALASQGVVEDVRLLISMPTCPQGVIAVYAANKLGAVASLIHPLSPAREVAFFLKASRATHALTLDAFYPVFREAMEESPLQRLVLTRMQDYLPFPVDLGFSLTKGRKIKRVPRDPRVVWWRDLMRRYHIEPVASTHTPDDTAVVLFSGGTTGRPKGIELTNRNIVSEGMQAAVWGGVKPGDSILAILPIFHGFGLGVCINAFFMGGGKVILVPQFSAEIAAGLIRRRKPSFIVGVPTLYQALTTEPKLRNADLSCLRGAFCGADRLPREVKERFEQLVRDGGGDVTLLEGYGLTESVTAVLCMPLAEYREGSIGIPFPDMAAKVVDPETFEEQPPGEIGELCIAGPAVMKGYLEQPDETAETLKVHPDGETWLHTGDLCHMDDDGFFFFRERLKRMIKSSGMNVYPGQVEDVLRTHPGVEEACVVGVPDEAQVERVVAVIVAADGHTPGPELEADLVAHCREHLIKWSCPREIAFRESLPQTLVGKVDYRTVEREEIAKRAEEGLVVS